MTKKIIYLFFSVSLLLSAYGGNTGKKSEERLSKQIFKVLQFNIWQEGTIVPGGYEGIIQQIIASDADFVTLSEVRNYDNSRFCDKILQSLKDSGYVFYSFYTYDSGILSKYPILDSTTVYPCVDDHGSAYRALIDMSGQEIVLYTAHLDYLNDTYYDVKGYSGSTWKKRAPMLDIDSILTNNVLSKRDDAMRAILDMAKKDRSKNRIVIIGGDFNEPSHQDWIESTKNMYDRQGLIVPWTVSKMLEGEGYIDAYREKYPNPATHPGITYPSNNDLVDIRKLTWAPEADERERIDFIYFYPSDELELTDVVIWGPNSSIERSKRVKDKAEDPFMIGGGVWPTDHKAVLATFAVSKIRPK